MAGNADGARFGLASCVAATDTILRALARVSERDELAGLMNAMTRELGFRYYALIHHDDLRGEPADRVKLLDYPAAIEDRLIGEGIWRRDPVIRGCIFAQRAFRWSELPGIIAMDRRDRESILEAEEADFRWDARVDERWIGAYESIDDAEFEVDRIAICGQLDGQWFCATMLVDGDGQARGMMGCRQFRSLVRAREAMLHAH